MRRPSEIAQALQGARSDLEVQYGNAGGGVMCITAVYADTEYDEAESIYIGMADGHLGWSDGLGDEWGDWPAIDDYEEWYDDRPMRDGDVAIALLAAVLHERLPRKDES